MFGILTLRVLRYAALSYFHALAASAPVADVDCPEAVARTLT